MDTEIIRKIIGTVTNSAILGVFSILIFRDKIKFKTLYPKRVQAIEEINSQFKDVTRECSKLVDKIHAYYKDLKKSVEPREYLEYDQRVIALHKMIESHSIFFSDNQKEKMLNKVNNLKWVPNEAHSAFKPKRDDIGIRLQNEHYLKLIRYNEENEKGPSTQRSTPLLGTVGTVYHRAEIKVKR